MAAFLNPPSALWLLILLPCTIVSSLKTPNLPCSAWRLSVETNNLRDWKIVPSKCVPYIAKYMTDGQYVEDFGMVIQQSMAYVKKLKIVGDGRDAWIFDIDETTLSNLPYYERHKFGGEIFDSKPFDEWVMEGKAPALAYSRLLYKQLLSRGIKVFFLTGRDEEERNTTVQNLLDAGYKHWSGLILKGESDQGKISGVYKPHRRGELVKKGYRIWGNVGDQWSDLIGQFAGARTFKLPNPMYFIS
eukprot:Gb_32263 [translate_table: standard]